MSGKENRVLLEQNEFLTTERKLQHQINLNENTPIKKKTNQRKFFIKKEKHNQWRIFIKKTRQ